MPQILWSLPLDSPPRGLSLAREARRVLVWTESNWLFWTNVRGERQAQAHFPATIQASAISDDGSSFVTAEDDGRFCWLAPDLIPRWDRRVKGKPTAVAVDPLGLIAAVATNQSQLILIHADGEIAREVNCPRPARHLAFIPGTGTLIAAADLGWISAYDIELGDWTWRDAPVASIGGMAVAGIGEPILLACFSEGLRGYRKDGTPWKFSGTNPRCQNIALDYHSRMLLTVLLDGTITGLTPDLKPRFSHQPGGTPLAIAVSALEDRFFLAQSDSRIVCLSIPARHD